MVLAYSGSGIWKKEIDVRSDVDPMEVCRAVSSIKTVEDSVPAISTLMNRNATVERFELTRHKDQLPH